MREPPWRCGCCAPPAARGLGRRAALVAGAASLLAPRARAQSLPPPPKQGSPAVAMDRLLRGNTRYANDDVQSLDQDTTIIGSGTVIQQPVFAAVLACTDLAVPVELLFDQPVGSLHTVQTPGNVVTADAAASLDYAVSGQGAAAVLVLGHSRCAAIAAAVRAKPAPGKPGPYAAFARAIFEARGDATTAAHFNALIQATILARTSATIANRVRAGRLALVAAYFDASTGRVTIAI